MLALSGCGAESAARAPADPAFAARAAAVDEVCAPLPRHAFDCVVSWPGAVGAARRPLVMSVSEGGVWTREGSPARMVASCLATDTGTPARVTVVVLERAMTAVELDEVLPLRVRWEGEACEADACDLPLASVDGTRLVIRQRTLPASTDEPDDAGPACDAVRRGAVEARSRRVGSGRVLRALEPSEHGLTITTTTLDVRQEPTVQHLDWSALRMRQLDDRIEHDAAVREAERGRIQPESEIDVSNAALAAHQIALRLVRLERRPTRAHALELAALARRAFAAHPAELDFGRRAVAHAVAGGDLDAAADALAALEEAAPHDDALPTLRLAIAIGHGDTQAAADALDAPGMDASARQAVADALVGDLAAVPEAVRVVRGVALVDDLVRIRIAMHDTLTASLTTAPRGAALPSASLPRVLAALAGCEAPQALVVCGAGLATATAVEGSAIRVSDGRCAGWSGRMPRGEALAAPLADAGAVRVAAMCAEGGAVLAGTLGRGTLQVERAGAAIAHRDFGRVLAELAAPLAELEARTFPTPPVHLALDGAGIERAQAIAQRDHPLVRCEPIEPGLLCATRGDTTALARFVAAVYASGAD
jgi:hypothetical protein